MAGGAVARHSAANQQQEANQNAQIADLQQQQAAQTAPPPMAPPAPAPMAAPPAPAAPAKDPVEVLKQLGELKAAGVITQDEFDAKKAELLKQI
jgi:hypothetical protein